MRLSYDSENKNVMMEGQGDIVIPRKVCFDMDMASLGELEKQHGITLSIDNFQFKGKPSILDKIKMILRIIKLK